MQQQVVSTSPFQANTKKHLMGLEVVLFLNWMQPFGSTIYVCTLDIPMQLLTYE
jgi:hypothetical protein